MKRTETSIRQQRRKRKIGAVAYKKKLRSKIPRRKRFQISPILSGSSNLLFSHNKPDFSAFAETSSSSSCFPDEISWISIGYEQLKKKPRSFRRKRKFEEKERSEVVLGVDDRSFRQLEEISEEEFRRVTTSCHREREYENTVENKGVVDVRVELSESSCLESFCGAETRFLTKIDEFPAKNLKLKTGKGDGVSKAGEDEGNAASAAISLSESSCVQTSPQEKHRSFRKSGELSQKLYSERDNGAGNSHAIRKSESTSEISCVESLTEFRNQNLYPPADDSLVKTTEENRGPVSVVSEISRNYEESNLSVHNSKSIAKDFGCDVELACSENLLSEDDSYSSSSHEMTISNLDSELSGEFSDSCPWLRVESPSDFSERSYGNSAPSPCFSLFLQFSQQFSKSSSRPNGKASSRVEDENPDEISLLRFENKEHEESYRNFRYRERRQSFLHDYTEDYYSTTEYGELVLQQRLLMVNWIVEQSNAKELRPETMFLGVNLLDRFLSEGFFKQKRNLQLVGIACLTLATRIEENQPLNCVRQKFFHVGSTVYSSCEVVAMEWLVQEVLDFQCFLPTTHNFLWFYLKAAKADAEVEKRAKHLAVLSMLDHRHLCFWPSTVAAGLVTLASLAGNHDSSCQWVMETHVRTKKDDLEECIKSLEWLVNYVG